MPILSLLFAQLRLLEAHLSECSNHPYQKVIYPSHDNPEKNIKKFKAVAKTLPVPFVLYADFEAFLVAVENNKESATKVRQLHKPSGFACLGVSQVPKFNRKIITCTSEDCITVFFEYVKDQDRYVHAILSDAKPMNPLTAEQQIAYAKGNHLCSMYRIIYQKEQNDETSLSLSCQYMGSYCNTCNLKLKYKRGSHAKPETDKKSSKRKTTKYFNGTFRTNFKEGRRW